MPDDDATARDLDAYKQIVALWAQENPIKTAKLQVLLAVNGGLLATVPLTHGFGHENWPVYAAGLVLSLVWTFSIGRTSLFQKAWQIKMKAIADRYPNDVRFHAGDADDALGRTHPFLRFVGGVPSKYYLLGAPILFAAFWALVLIANVSW